MTSLKDLSLSFAWRKRAVAESLCHGKRVLNVGCGDGDYFEFLCGFFDEVHGVDINFDDLATAKSRNPRGFYSLGSVEERLPFCDDFFDCVVCTEVLEHLGDDASAVTEMSRVLCDRGWLIVTVPTTGFSFFHDPVNFVLGFFGRHLPIGVWGFGHQRLYDEPNLSKLLQEHGFKIAGVRHGMGRFSGLFENFYLLNALQPLVKTSPSNKGSFGRKSKYKEIDLGCLFFLRECVSHFDGLVCGNRGLQLFVKSLKEAKGNEYKRFC